MDKAYTKILDTITVTSPLEVVTRQDVQELMQRQLEIFVNNPQAREAIMNHVLLQAFATIGAFNPRTVEAANEAKLFAEQTMELKYNKVSKKGFSQDSVQLKPLINDVH